jgi:hypothetical protein
MQSEFSERSKCNLSFQSATWQKFKQLQSKDFFSQFIIIFNGLGVSSPNLRFCRLNICTKRPQSGVWMN